MPGNRRLLPLLAVLGGLALPAAPARADLITACAPEIQRFCADVSSGRGRISACLASEMARLSAACRPEAQGVMQSPLTPGYVRRALDTSFKASPIATRLANPRFQASASTVSIGLAQRRGEAPAGRPVAEWRQRRGGAIADQSSQRTRCPKRPGR